MIKYLGYSVVFQEIPDEITLGLNITNCLHRCKGCHSPELWEDIGSDLEQDLPNLLSKYSAITCVCLFGEGNDPDAFDRCLSLIRKERPDLKIAWYTGMNECDDAVLRYITSGKIDYIKTGEYIESLGGLDHPTTNQKLFRIENGKATDITYKFYKKGYLKE